MELERIKEFMVFAKYLNVTKASRELLMTQSNLSKHIKQLEGELGFAVMSKKGTKLILTHEGERFLNTCNEIIALYEKTVEACRVSQRERRSDLTVQEPSYTDRTAEAYYRLIEELRASASDASIRFFRPYRKNLFHELQDKKMDIMLHYGSGDIQECRDRFAQQGLLAKPLAHDSLAIWCNVDHRLAQLERVSFADLRGVPIIAPNDVYTPIKDLVVEYSERFGVELTFDIVESDRSATFLSMRRPESVYLLPQSVSNDLRARVRSDMVFRDVEDGKLAFVSYAIMRADELDIFPEFEAPMAEGVSQP